MTQTPEPRFPALDLAQAMTHLGRPFAPEALRFKVQATWPKDNPKNGLIVPYVDARTVSARLNHVAGPNWTTTFEPWGERDTSLAVCHLTLYGQTRSDIGKGSGLEKDKAAFSDALKRAAVHFGPGAYIYTLSSVVLGTVEEEGKAPPLKVKTSGNKKTLELTPACETWLRSNYERWLKSDRNRWGEALDHGDVEDSLGDPVERPAPSADAQEDLELEAKREEARQIYKTIPAKNRPNLAPGKFRAKLEAASNGQVDELIAELKEMAA